MPQGKVKKAKVNVQGFKRPDKQRKSDNSGKVHKKKPPTHKQLVNNQLEKTIRKNIEEQVRAVANAAQATSVRRK